MILIIIAIAVALGTVGYVMYRCSASDSHEESVGEVLQGIGWVTTGIGVTSAIVLLIVSIIASTADEKIEMYQEENTKIERQISDVIEQYQKYETDIFTELSPESSMTMISLYPELKSDRLVESQIEVYVKNNEQIKYLKEQLISRSVINWWLYFGK